MNTSLDLATSTIRTIIKNVDVIKFSAPTTWNFSTTKPDANYEEDSRGWFGRFKRAEQEFPEEDVQQLLESHSESLSNDDLKELVELYTRGEPTVVDEVELKTDSSARDMFEEKSVIEFQPFICGSYPKVAETAIHALFPFVPTYRCESAFLTPLKMKTKQ
ncbi:Zinc finger BED domain-containing protein [Trichinella spiralis]|uniref:Zinc finger BED domain-containing protein n=1 Tax=Trichinella spiralis TaxID=6334 RepID=A0ABR3KY90_TRISP